MSAASHDPEQGRDRAVVLLLDLADTTWRMFVPPTLTVGGGLYADTHWGTKPWLTLVGVPVGLALSILLVRRQLRKAGNS